MKKHKYATLATVMVITVLAGGAFLPGVCGGHIEDAEQGTFPGALLETAKDADAVLALVPKVEQDGSVVRIWITLFPRDSKTDSFTTDGIVWTNFVIRDAATAYFTCSLNEESDMALRLAVITDPNLEQH